MSDKELLELAAKAHGGLVYVEGMGWIHEDATGNRGAWWNPLTDDSDALRLAVKLEIVPSKHVDTVVPSRSATWRVGHACSSLWEPAGNDPYAATRRAIVRAAAAIGEALK